MKVKELVRVAHHTQMNKFRVSPPKAEFADYDKWEDCPPQDDPLHKAVMVNCTRYLGSPWVEIFVGNMDEPQGMVKKRKCEDEECGEAKRGRVVAGSTAVKTKQVDAKCSPLIQKGDAYLNKICEVRSRDVACDNLAKIDVMPPGRLSRPSSTSSTSTSWQLRSTTGPPT